ncbi:MAG: hypothetical protein ACRC2R_11595 [Xenococcaceae cyanobacterium]
MIEQLELFSVSNYTPYESRFGTVVTTDLLTGTLLSPSQKIPVSKRTKLRRDKGLGTGRIIHKETTIIKKGKEYKYTQSWFAWEEWNNGKCQMRSKYIPKKLRDRIIGMNLEKLPVEEIIKILK